MIFVGERSICRDFVFLECLGRSSLSVMTCFFVKQKERRHRK
jgi:hypothetical protein